ncbi:hypothetical protein HK104_000660 [Borealophlyctis nickersoniae]|nr:hypothetical protein HK104_000660 [Borealophlyctis nickersoniae]
MDTLQELTYDALDILQELKDNLSNDTLTPDTLLPAFRKWKKKVGIPFIDNFSEDEEDSPWNMRRENNDDCIAILRFLTLLEIHQRAKSGQEGMEAPTTAELVVSIANLSYGCYGDRGREKRNARMNGIMTRCFDVAELKIGHDGSEPAFSDPLWVADRIIRGWIEVSSGVADGGDVGDDEAYDVPKDSSGRYPKRRKRNVPGGPSGGNVTVGDVMYYFGLPDGVVDDKATPVKTLGGRLEDAGTNLLAAVVNCFATNNVVQFHMQRFEEGIAMCSYKTVEGREHGFVAYEKQNRKLIAKPQSVGAKKRKRKRKTHRDPSYKAKRNKTDSAEKMEMDGESVAESTEDENEEEEGGEEEGEEITDGEEGDGEVEDGNQDKQGCIDQKRNKDDKSKEGESSSELDKKGAKYLDVDKVVQALKNFEAKEIKKRIELFGLENLENMAFDPQHRVLEQHPQLALKSVVEQVSAWEKNRKIITFQLFIWAVALVNAYDKCIKEAVEGRKILTKAGHPYPEVPDHPNNAFIEAADKWLKKEGIVTMTPVLRRHRKVGRCLRYLAKEFSEAILLLNYEDEDLHGIEKINKDDWQALTAALSKLKESSSPPGWIHFKLPRYAQRILGLHSPVEPSTPTRSHNNTDKNHLPSPAPTPQKSKTATHHHPEARKIFRSKKDLYTDDCFHRLLEHATRNHEDVRYLNSLTRETDTRREGVQAYSRLAVTEDIEEFVAPVNRDGNHWVAYAGRRNAKGTWSWRFADSMGGDTRRYEYEINDIQRLLNIPAPDVASIEKNVNIPRQTDNHNCGPFALQWLLKFLDDTEPIEIDPLKIRKRHLQMLNDAEECKKKKDSTSEKDLEDAAEDVVIVTVESKTTSARRLFEEEEDGDDVLPGDSAVARDGDEKRERHEGTGSATQGSALLVPQKTDLNGQTEGSDVKQRNKRSIEKVAGRVDEDVKGQTPRKKSKPRDVSISSTPPPATATSSRKPSRPAAPTTPAAKASAPTTSSSSAKSGAARTSGTSGKSTSPPISSSDSSKSSTALNDSTGENKEGGGQNKGDLRSVFEDPEGKDGEGNEGQVENDDDEDEGDEEHEEEDVNGDDNESDNDEDEDEGSGGTSDDDSDSDDGKDKNADTSTSTTGNSLPAVATNNTEKKKGKRGPKIFEKESLREGTCGIQLRRC